MGSCCSKKSEEEGDCVPQELDKGKFETNALLEQTYEEIIRSIPIDDPVIKVINLQAIENEG